MIALGGKKVELEKLQAEMVAAGLAEAAGGLGRDGDWVFPYDATGQPVEFSNVATAQGVVATHVATRPMTDQELLVAYADAAAKGDTVTVKNVLAMLHRTAARTQVPA